MQAAEVQPTVIKDGSGWLALELDIPHISAPDLLEWFVDARLVNQWWGSEAIIEPRIGGRYLVSWPEQGWTMRGVVALLTADILIYSWTWDHEPDQVPRTVVVSVRASGSGATVTLCQGPYRDGSSGDPEAATDRAGHREGWGYFLPQLRAKIAATTGAS
jgi:uncharacterized protein YndB with AHSA1/START domain